MDGIGTKTPPVASRTRSLRRTGIWLAFVVLLSGLYLLRSVLPTEARSDTDAAQKPALPAASPQPGDVHALARLEPLSGLIIIGGRPGARIERIEVGQGDKIAAGQLLAILEGHDQARAQLALAEAQKARALHRAFGAEAEAGARARTV